MDRGSPIAANGNLGLLRQLFKFAIQRDMIESSPCEAVDYPAKARPRDRVLTESEIKTFWKQLPDVGLSPTLQLVLKFCLVTAQRRGEVVNAEKSEFEDGWWTIPSPTMRSPSFTIS